MPELLNYPNNSNRAKRGPIVEEPDEAPKEAPRMKKVVKGPVTKKQKGFLDSFSETFFGESLKDVGQYLWYDVLVPAAKDTLTDLVTIGIRRAVYGEEARAPESGRTRRSGGTQYVSYDSMSRDRERVDRRDNPRNDGRRIRRGVSDIVVRTRGDAQRVLEAMLDEIDEYKACTVASFYDACGEESTFVDNKWGWRNLRSASYEPARGGGYCFVLPEPVMLD